MADTFTVISPGTTFALNKCMLGVFNGSGSGKVVRLYRAWLLNNGVTAVTGVLTNIELRRTTTGSGGSAITPMPHDSTNAALPSQLAIATNQSVTTSDLFRRLVWSNDEATANVACTIDELETLPQLSQIWDVGYGDLNVEPIVCREGQGVALINTGNTSVGSVDVIFEITVASS